MKRIVLIPREVTEATRLVRWLDWARLSRADRTVETDKLLRAHFALMRALAAQGKTVLQ
jgi:hypothetical protein